MAVNSINREFWREFIELYKSLPAVWKVKSESYKNRNLKNEAYDQLSTKLKEIEPTADREMVRKKINALRTNYRRELAKIKTSEKCATSLEDVYVPSLWYFEEIDFLRDQEIPSEGGKSAVDSENEDVPEQIPTPATSSVPKRSTRKRPAENDHRKEVQPTVFEHLRSSDDEVEIMGKGWMAVYKKLRPDQQIFAKKAIDDILFEACLGTLHRHSVQINNAVFAGASRPLVTDSCDSHYSRSPSPEANAGEYSSTPHFVYSSSPVGLTSSSRQTINDSVNPMQNYPQYIIKVENNKRRI